MMCFDLSFSAKVAVRLSRDEHLVEIAVEDWARGVDTQLVRACQVVTADGLYRYVHEEVGECLLALGRPAESIRKSELSA